MDIIILSVEPLQWSMHPAMLLRKQICHKCYRKLLSETRRSGCAEGAKMGKKGTPQGANVRSKEAAGKAEHTDRRVVRTKAAILDAFWSLLEERDYIRITVSDLADRAQINRKTFYVYYNSMDDLVGEVEEMWMAEYEPIFRAARGITPGFEPYEFIQKLYRKITQDYHKLSLFNHKGLLPHFIDKIKNLVITIFLAEYRSEDEKQNARLVLYLEYTAAGALSMLTSWTQKKQLSLEEFTDFLSTFVLQGFATLKSWENAGCGHASYLEEWSRAARRRGTAGKERESSGK